MKSWWFSSFVLIAIGCGNPEANSEKSSGVDTVGENVEAKEDTLVEPVESDKTRTDESGETITANKTLLPEVIEHKAPQESTIDSAKKAKTKLKK